MPLHEQQSKVSLEIDRQYLEDCSNLLLLTGIMRGALHHWLALQQLPGRPMSLSSTAGAHLSALPWALRPNPRPPWGSCSAPGRP